MVKIDFHKEIKIIPLYKVVLPGIISYIIVIIAYFGGEDGLFFLVCAKGLVQQRKKPL